jgi:hypothetical protein
MLVQKKHKQPHSICEGIVSVSVGEYSDVVVMANRGALLVVSTVQ